MSVTYTQRIVDTQLANRLASAGAILIEGPKSCGKTETARQHAASEVLLDIDAAARSTLEIAPQALLAGPTPMLIDEWQLAPEVWNLVRREVDNRRGRGQFILTGSATPTADTRRHSGAGRFSVIRMRPMSLAESGESSKTVSLDALLSGREQQAPDPGLTIESLVAAICRGGWPALIGSSANESSLFLRDYLTNVSHVDIPSISGSMRSPTKVALVLASLARHTSTEAGIATIASDITHSDQTVDRRTATDYIEALDRLMLVEDQPAWSPRLRSRAAIRTTPKRHFVDPSLAVAAMGATQQQLLRDPKTLGLLFESLVVRDLRVLSGPLDATVHHYRDSSQLEIDAIVRCADGRWGAFEVKLGASQMDAAARQLRRFKDRVDLSGVGEPSVLAVVTGRGVAYKRPDGVHVVPIGCLGP